MSPRRRSDNEARLVRCSAGCGTLTWLKGALPVAADTEHLCASCTAGEPPESLNDEGLTPGGWAKSR